MYPVLIILEPNSKIYMYICESRQGTGRVARDSARAEQGERGFWGSGDRDLLAVCSALWTRSVIATAGRNTVGIEESVIATAGRKTVSVEDPHVHARGPPVGWADCERGYFRFL